MTSIKPSQLFPDTVLVNNRSRPGHNSLGEPIADNEEKLTAFWGWYGDSMNVDVFGRPIPYFRSQRTSHPHDKDLVDRYFTSDEVYAQSYVDGEHDEFILKFYIHAKKLSIQDNINNVTDFCYEDLGLGQQGYDAVCDTTRRVMVAIGGDYQFRAASEFNAQHQNALFPPKVINEGRAVVTSTGCLAKPVVGKSGDSFYAGYQLLRINAEKFSQLMISEVWLGKHDVLLAAKKEGTAYVSQHYQSNHNPANELSMDV